MEKIDLMNIDSLTGFFSRYCGKYPAMMMIITDESNSQYVLSTYCGSDSVLNILQLLSPLIFMTVC